MMNLPKSAFSLAAPAFFILSLFFGLHACFSTGVRAQEAGCSVVGWIEIAPVSGQTDRIEIVGRVYGLKAAAGRYALDVRRADGGGGRSTSRQGGDFRVAAGENATLSRHAINIPPGSAVEITLTLYAGDREVFSVTMKPALSA